MEIVYYVAASLDGYIATDTGGVDWLAEFGNPADYGYEAFYASLDGLVMGSHTYEVSLGLGPWMGADQPSWVFTSRELPQAHPSVTLTGDAPAVVVARLASRGLKRVWLMGGGKLATSFLSEGLLTECRIFVMPLTLGSGVPLFAPGPSSTRLRLLNSRSYDSGVVELRYASSTGRADPSV